MWEKIHETRRVDSRAAATSVQIHFRAESVPRGGGPRPLPPGPRGGGPRLCGNQSVFTKSDSARRLREILISTLFFAVARLVAAGRAAAGPWAAAHGAAGHAAVLPCCSTSLGAALSSLAAAFRSETPATASYSPPETVQKPFRQRRRRTTAPGMKNSAASGPLLLQVGAGRRPKNGQTRCIIRPY